MAQIRFKRGTTCSVQNYINAEVGEPIYDYETGRLYVKNVHGDLQSVDTLGVALEGPTTVYPGNDYSYVINNFSSFRTYNIDHNLGGQCTTTRNGKNIDISLGSDITESDLELSISVDNIIEKINIPFGVETVVTNPTLPYSDGQTDVSLNPTFDGGTFETTPPGLDTHESTDWQIASDATFSIIVEESLNDTSNLTSWTPSTLDSNTTYHFRYRYNGSTLGPGNWSEISFTTENIYIELPTVTSHSDGDVSVDVVPTFNTSSFVTNPTGSDTHQSTDWQIASDSGFTTIVQESLNDTSNLNSWTPSALSGNTTYHFRVRYNGSTLAPSNWNEISFTTLNQVVLTNSDLNSTTSGSPYDADASGNNYTFEFDANQFDSIYISNFSSDHIIKFINSPTASDGDLNVTNTDYTDGSAVLTVGDVDVYLSNLSDSTFWNATSFRGIYGTSSLVIE